MKSRKFVRNEIVYYGGMVGKVVDYRPESYNDVGWWTYELALSNGQIIPYANEANLCNASYDQKIAFYQEQKFNERAQNKKGDYLVISAHTTTNFKRTYLHTIADAVSHALSFFGSSNNHCNAFYVVEIKKVIHGPKTVQTQLPATIHDWNGEC